MKQIQRFFRSFFFFLLIPVSIKFQKFEIPMISKKTSTNRTIHGIKDRMETKKKRGE